MSCNKTKVHQSIPLACLLKILRKKSHSHSDKWLAADVLEFVVGNPQTQEHPRINLDENTQTERSFHMVCMLVSGSSFCLFKGFLGARLFIFARYFEETCQRWILKSKHLCFEFV